MANTIKLLFWLHKSKANKEGLAPLILRLSFQKKAVEKATGFYVNPNHWNAVKQRLTGNKKPNSDINDRLNEIVSRFVSTTRGSGDTNNLHLPSIMEQLFAAAKEEPTLLSLISEHNEQLKAKVGHGIAYSTFEKYVFTYQKVKAFIKSTTRRDDILLRDLDTKFIMDFDHFLRVNDNNQHNTAVKYCINLKRILNVAVMQGMLTKSPLNSFKTVYRDTPQVYLSEQELSDVEGVLLHKPSHALVRDLFIFQCNTGLAYTDMVSLKVADISVDHHGRHWIVKARQKTGVTSTIPITTRAKEIIDKYSGVSPNGLLFRNYAIQKYNEYIAVIGKDAGLSKRLSSHVGRRTFGNIALAKGISINVISKILGHSSILITQRIYAITTQNIISKEIEKW